eukprot:5140091-Alexandrium_andersonii.AAC.1
MWSPCRARTSPKRADSRRAALKVWLGPWGGKSKEAVSVGFRLREQAGDSASGNGPHRPAKVT